MFSPIKNYFLQYLQPMLIFLHNLYNNFLSLTSIFIAVHFYKKRCLLRCDEIKVVLDWHILKKKTKKKNTIWMISKLVYIAMLECFMQFSAQLIPSDERLSAACRSLNFAGELLVAAFTFSLHNYLLSS